VSWTLSLERMLLGSSWTLSLERMLLEQILLAAVLLLSWRRACVGNMLREQCRLLR